MNTFIRLHKSYSMMEEPEMMVYFLEGQRHTKDVIKMVPVVPLFGTQH